MASFLQTFPYQPLPLECYLQNTFRFYHHTVAVIALLAMAHLTCFVVSVVMLNAQKQYIDEVDDAGIACIAMHRMAIDCRCARWPAPSSRGVGWGPDAACRADVSCMQLAISAHSQGRLILGSR